MENINEKKKLGLTTKIFIALILGCLCGIIIHYFVPESYVRDTLIVNGVFYVVGNGFLRLMKMLVVPLVFCSLVCGSMAMGDTKSLGKIGIRTLIFYLITTALAISIALGIGGLLRPGIGLDMSAIVSSETTVAEPTNVADTLLNIIPDNPISALANGTMLQIIFFALFIGILLAQMGERADIVANFFLQFNDTKLPLYFHKEQQADWIPWLPYVLHPVQQCRFHSVFPEPFQPFQLHHLRSSCGHQ